MRHYLYGSALVATLLIALPVSAETVVEFDAWTLYAADMTELCAIEKAKGVGVTFNSTKVEGSMVTVVWPDEAVFNIALCHNNEGSAAERKAAKAAYRIRKAARNAKDRACLPIATKLRAGQSVTADQQTLLNKCMADLYIRRPVHGD